MKEEEDEEEDEEKEKKNQWIVIASKHEDKNMKPETQVMVG
jgi:hypothetical protein